MSDFSIMTHDQAVVALSNPGTPPEALQQIATHFHDLHPYVARHPQAYDALREWMAAIAASAAPRAVTPAAKAVEPTPFQPAATSFQPAATSFQPAATSFQPASAYTPAAESFGSQPVPAAALSYASVSPQERSHHGKRTAIIAGLTVMVLAMVGVGAVAAYQKFLGPDGGIADSANALPASTFAMVELSIEPSTQQKLALSKTWGKLDGINALIEDSGASNEFTKDPGTELRPFFWKSMIDSLGVDTSLDYNKDIAPWLGGRLAIGMVGSAPSPQDAIVVAIECKDGKRGVDAVKRLIADGAAGSPDSLQVESRNGYIIIASAALDLDAAYADGVLADEGSFTGAVQGLGSRGLASFWMGTHSAVEATSAWMNDPSEQAEAAKSLDLIDANAAQAAVLRALDNGLEVQTVSKGGARTDALNGNADAGRQIGALPDTTAVAMSVQQLGGLMDAGLSQEGSLSVLNQGGLSRFANPLGSGLVNPGGYGQDTQQIIDEARKTIEDTLGLSIPDGVNKVFGNGVIVAMDQDLNCSIVFMGSGSECSDPHVAVLVSADDAKTVTDTVDGWADGSVADALSNAGIEATVSDDGHLVSWGTGSYAKGLVDTQAHPLSSLPAFSDALPDGDDATFAMFLSEPGILNIVKDLGGEPDSDVDKALGDIAAIGATSHMGADGTSTGRLRIIVSN